VYDEKTDIWWFSVIDVVQVLTQQSDDLIARKYWNQLKRRLTNEGSQLVTTCHQLKMPAADGKQRLTDVATAETLLRLAQPIAAVRPQFVRSVSAALMHTPACCTISMGWRPDSSEGAGRNPNQEMLK